MSVQIEELRAALKEGLEAHREAYERSMLESWDVDVPESREAVSEAYSAEYSKRCEGYSPGDGLPYWRELSSEDYEAVDYNEGWEYGFGAAQQIVEDIAAGRMPEAVRKAVDAGAWSES